jgi:hypothetical protein
MLAGIVTLCAEADRLRREGHRIDALGRYHEVLDHLRTLSGADSVALTLRAQSARSAAEILIEERGDQKEIYDLLGEERAALVDLIDIPVGLERLHRNLTTFTEAVKASDEAAAKQAATSVLLGLFGRVGPTNGLETHLAIIRNTLVKATVIFDREGDIDDARALAETTLTEILALLSDSTINVPIHPAIPLLTDTLDLLARLNGRDAGWFERAKIVCTLLPTARTPWTLGLIQPADIAALILGLGEPEAA